MSARRIFDSSVVMALINDEPGAETAQELLPHAAVLTVNVAEVATKLADKQFGRQEIAAILEPFAFEVVELDQNLAISTGLLRPLTRHLGLSLGDRACLAFGAQRRLPVYTAERKWAGLDLGVDVRLIR